MFRLRLLFFATLPLLASYPTMAATFAVGTCSPKLTSFSTISDAVGSVPPGSTIQVCPGVYPEQITISRPLTLQGIEAGNQDQVVITVPSVPLAANVTSIFTESVAAQILVQNASPVNITNISVDGTGGDQACGTSNTWLAGIFYASGSSGTVNQVRASGQTDEGCGVGIWAENGGSPNRSVIIQNSSVHDVDGTGIFVGAGSTPTLTVTIQNNFVSVHTGIGIFLNSVHGEIKENNVNDALVGVWDVAPEAHVSTNTVTATTFGIFLLSSGTVQSNDISNSAYGVVLLADGANIHSNSITLATTAGVELACNNGTVSDNRINDAAIGLDQVPLGFKGSNTFANTGMISTDGCVAAAASASSIQAPSQTASPSSFSQWRTPANPLGSRP